MKKLIILTLVFSSLASGDFLRGLFCGSLTGATPGIILLDKIGISPYSELRTDRYYISSAVAATISRAGLLVWAANSLYSEGPSCWNMSYLAGTVVDGLLLKHSI